MGFYRIFTDFWQNLVRSRKDSKIRVESCNVVRAGFNCEEVSENVTPGRERVPEAPSRRHAAVYVPIGTEI